jgi:hypothetical protein
MVALPTTPGVQPTPAQTRSLFSSGRFQDLAKFSVQTFGSQPGGMIEQFRKWRSFEGQYAELSEDFLLPHSEAQHFDRKLRVRRSGWRFFNHELARLRLERDNGNHSARLVQ